MKKAVLIFLVLVFAACTQQALQTTYDKQTTTIESFVTAQMKADETATLTRMTSSASGRGNAKSKLLASAPCCL